MPDRPAQRREALRTTLKARDLPALLVTSETNVRYLSGFTGDSSALLVGRDADWIISDGRYDAQLQAECPELKAHIRPVSQTLIAAIAKVVEGLGAGSVGFEAPHFTVANLEALRAELPTADLVPTKGHVEALRAVKDEEEIASIRAAISIAERAFALFKAGLRLDASEKQTADDLEHHLRNCGAQSSSFPPIVATGPHSALPHARPRPEIRLDHADFLLVDWGACLVAHPYKSDLTRMIVTGKVSSKFEEVYRAVLTAQQRAIALIRPGIKAEAVDAEARSVIEKAGFGPFFSHGLGHGIGLDIHEAPSFREGSADVLQPGMIVTVEPGIYLADWGGIRIEDDVLVTSEGCEVLSNVPRALESVRLA